MPVRFDDSIKILVGIIADHFGSAAFETGCVLRDASGRLAYFHAAPVSAEEKDALAEKLQSQLGVYARSDRCIAALGDFGVADIINEPFPLKIFIGKISVRLIDRRLVGADWLRQPKEAVVSPPRFVFASLKGGVGRSTALSVIAAQLASKGRSVLTIDMDMEAPGLGSMLLRPDELPKYGLIDALVENGFGKLDDGFMSDLVSPSSLAQGLGRIDVIPAFGAVSLQNPANILAKISRAYAEDATDDGVSLTLLDQISEIVDYYSLQNRYQAILIDARAGLHESTAAAILGLGAEIFCFGLDEPQTFAGYEALFAHLTQLIDQKSKAPEWLDRITMVQGKAPAEISARKNFAERCDTMFETTGLITRVSQVRSGVPLPAEPFSNVPWNDDAGDDEDFLELFLPQQTLAVLHDERFKLFNPLVHSDLLATEIYRSSFGSLVERVEQALPSA